MYFEPYVFNQNHYWLGDYRTYFLVNTITLKFNITQDNLLAYCSNKIYRNALECGFRKEYALELANL